MASLATTTKRIAKHPHTRRVAWIAAAGVAVVATIGGLIWYEEKSAKAAGPAAPPVPPAPPPSQIPVWTQLQPVANPQAPGSYMVTIPAGASFAFADSNADPNLPAIYSGMLAASNAGAAAQAWIAYSPGPAFPTDNFGANAYRVTGVANQAFNLSLGPLSAVSPTSTPMVWLATGFQNA